MATVVKERRQGSKARAGATQDAITKSARPKFAGRDSANSASVGFEIPLAALQDAVRLTYPFTDRATTAHFHLTAILMEVGDDEVTFTAESDARAIEVSVPHSGVTSTGRMLVPAGNLSTALSVLGSNGTAFLEYDGDTLFIYTSERRRDEDGVSIKVPRLDGKSLLPAIGEADVEHGIEMDSSTFADRFGVVCASRDASGNIPVLRGVLMELVTPRDGEGAHLSLLASNKLSTTTHQVPIGELIGDGVDDMLLDSDNVLFVLDLLRSSDRVRLHGGVGREQVHLFGRNGRSEQSSYHVRLSPLRLSVKQFPSATLRKIIMDFVPRIFAYVKVNKSDLLDLLGRAATMCSLDPVATEGQAKVMKVHMDSQQITVEVRGEAGFSDVVEVADWECEEWSGIQFLFRYGLFSGLLRSYPGQTITIALFSDKAPGTVKGILLTETSEIEDDELPPYTCFFGVTKGVSV